MAMEKLPINLRGISQTLLIPLLGRATFSKLSFSPIKDERAIELIEKLDFRGEKYTKNLKTTHLLWGLSRSYYFDEALRNYLKTHPYATIVNLGAGLETAFYRVDNGLLNWIDLDLPEVIALRQKLLPAPSRVKYLAKSLLDYSWMDDVKACGTDVFFFAGGFFMYFAQQQIRSLFLHMANYFPHAEIIFDNISLKLLPYGNKRIKKLNMHNIPGINDGKVMETWSPKIILRRQTGCFNHLKQLKSFPLFMRSKMYFYDFMHTTGIIHLRFARAMHTCM